MRRSGLLTVGPAWCAAMLLGVVSAAAAAPLVVTDPSAINVCERVPGADVAHALGKLLKSERPIVVRDSKLSRCVYLLASPGKNDPVTEGLVLWLYMPQQYAELNGATQSKLEPVPALGDQAVRFLDSGDGRHKLRALRKDRYAIEATAPDSASALALGRLAVERLDR